jgi:hypothetical protein
MYAHWWCLNCVACYFYASALPVWNGDAAHRELIFVRALSNFRYVWYLLYDVGYCYRGNCEDTVFWEVIPCCLVAFSRFRVTSYPPPPNLRQKEMPSSLKSNTYMVFFFWKYSDNLPVYTKAYSSMQWYRLYSCLHLLACLRAQGTATVCDVPASLRTLCKWKHKLPLNPSILSVWRTSHKGPARKQCCVIAWLLYTRTWSALLT